MNRQILESSAKYVYCVIRAPQEQKSFGDLGFDAGEVYSLVYRDLAPVVSDVAFRNYAVNEGEVEVHRKVVESIMKEYSVIPVAYGMAFKSRKLLQIAMGAGYQAMQKALDVVDGKVELGIKVFLPKDHEEWDGAKRQECSSEFVQNLLAVSADWKKLKLFSDRLVLNAAFLVDKSSIDEFSEQVGKLTGKYEHLKVQYSGPWPAYNFVDIHILGGKRRGFRQMFFIDDLLLRTIGISLPGLDMIWTLEQLQKFAYKGLYNPEKIKNQIKETRLLYEFGEMTRQEYEAKNADLMHKLDLALKADEMNLGSRTDILGQIKSMEDQICGRTICNRSNM